MAKGILIASHNPSRERQDQLVYMLAGCYVIDYYRRYMQVVSYTQHGHATRSCHTCLNSSARMTGTRSAVEQRQQEQHH